MFSCDLGSQRFDYFERSFDVDQGFVEIAQIALRWLVQQGNIAPIPRSSNAAHMAESLRVFDFALSEDEMHRIHALARPDGRIANPRGRAPAWD